MVTLNKAELEALTAKIVEAVRAHALENYNKNGWDVVVESYTDEEIKSLIGNCWTVSGAIKKMKPYVEGRFEFAQDIINS